MRQDYIEPQKAPYAWNLQRDEALSQAVKSFFASHGKDVSAEQLILIRQYLTYYINAACWRDESGQVLPVLRQRVAEINDAQQLKEWISVALTLGIDPF